VLPDYGQKMLREKRLSNFSLNDRDDQKKLEKACGLRILTGYELRQAEQI